MGSRGSSEKTGRSLGPSKRGTVWALRAAEEVRLPCCKKRLRPSVTKKRTMRVCSWLERYRSEKMS